MNPNTPGLPVHHQLPDITKTRVHWVGDEIQPSRPLSSPSPPAPNPSQHQGFCSVSALCISWPKPCSFSFSISPSKKYLGLISFRINWFDLLAVQGTLKSRLQYHSSKTSILWCSDFFMIQLTFVHDYWKNHSFHTASLLLTKVILMFVQVWDLCFQVNIQLFSLV